MAIRIHRPLLIPFLAVFFLNAGPSQRLTYESVQLDASGQLHIKTVNGKEVLAPKLPHQSQFGAPALSLDHTTVGWLAEFEDTSSPSPIDPDAFTLVLYRNGRILRLVSGDPIIWDWKFERGGKVVAYSTGSRHGGANECLLIDIDSGKVLKDWLTSSSGQAPSWAEQLRR
ncbi:MAG: hypothetical protein ACRD22_16615 [Terriglobia bacterium]